MIVARSCIRRSGTRPPPCISSMTRHVGTTKQREEAVCSGKTCPHFEGDAIMMRTNTATTTSHRSFSSAALEANVAQVDHETFVSRTGGVGRVYGNNNGSSTKAQSSMPLRWSDDNASKDTATSESEQGRTYINENQSLMKELHALASQRSTPLSLCNMYKYAAGNVESKNYSPQRLRNAQFLHRELPIRIAQRAVDLLTLPHGLNTTKQVQEIASIYISYLRTFQQMPCPTNDVEENAFTEMLRPMVLDRGSIPLAIAQGVSRVKDDRKEDLDIARLQEMEDALYRFFTARIGLRLLTEHHILSSRTNHEENEELRWRQSCLEKPQHHEDRARYHDEYLGCIKSDCDPVAEVRRVADQVVRDCGDAYGFSPTVEVLDCTPQQYRERDFTYVPHHLQYMVAELLKNSCRATVRRYMEGTTSQEDHSKGDETTLDHKAGMVTDNSLPPVRIVVVKGAEDVTIKIADKGGGVARSVVDRMWTFAHTTLSDELQSKENDTEFETDEFTGGNIRGFGLPLARIYARYFGGELTLKSMEGYGVDAYLYLPVLGEACENLPQRVLQSPANYDSIYDGNYGDLTGGVLQAQKQSRSQSTRSKDSSRKDLSLSSSEEGAARYYSTSTTAILERLAMRAL